MRKTLINIHPSKIDFYMGSCATNAISSAFDIPYKSLEIICSLLKIERPNKGMNFWQCKKLINLLGNHNNIKIEYIPNYGNLSYFQMLLVCKEDRYLVVFDEHLSYVEKGEIYDSFISDSCLKEDHLRQIPTGWWKLRLKTSIPYETRTLI